MRPPDALKGATAKRGSIAKRGSVARSRAAIAKLQKHLRQCGLKLVIHRDILADVWEDDSARLTTRSR